MSCLQPSASLLRCPHNLLQMPRRTAPPSAAHVKGPMFSGDLGKGLGGMDAIALAGSRMPCMGSCRRGEWQSPVWRHRPLPSVLILKVRCVPVASAYLLVTRPLASPSLQLQPQPQGLLPLAGFMALLKIDGPGERVPGMATGFSSFSFPFFHPEKSREI